MLVLCVGTLVVDIIPATIEKIPIPNDAVQTRIAVELGGNSYNVAADLVHLGVEPSRIVCLGGVGNDQFRELFRSQLNQKKIIHELFEDISVGTPKNIIIQEKGKERRYIYDTGANDTIIPEFITSAIKKYNARMLYIGELGCLIKCKGRLGDFLQQAKTLGSITVYDLIYASQEDRFLFPSVAKNIDILHCNDIEAFSLTDNKDPTFNIRYFSNFGISLSIVTMAEKGLYFGFQGKIHFVPPFHVDCIDPTGAGDAVTSMIIKQVINHGEIRDIHRIQEEEMKRIVIFAAASGAIATTELGCTKGVDLDRIDGLMKAQGDRVFTTIISEIL